ncbi:MAG: DEAD/DEAH box helicase, partial [Acidimicrobiales bacterium]|nr:DEAD/DEAH box helicase [Acidimicrobiales bacterium]
AQVQRELTALIDERAHGAVAAIYGGVGYGPQRKLLSRGVSAVVACPGRLEDLVGSGDVVLDQVELVVLDEADRMADMGFMPAVRRLLDETPDSRQTLLFSATLDGDVDKLVKHYQTDPVRHEVAGADDEVADVDHIFWKTPREKRVALTADIVRRTGSTIVFTRTRHGADRVAKQLGQAGIKAVPIHGRRSQAQRDQALRQFSTGRAPALVATDVAARGIHVDDVGCVVHFDMPDDPKDYVHRSGRTGRAGATGVVVSLVLTDGMRAMRALQRQVGRTEPIAEPDLELLGEVQQLSSRPEPEPEARPRARSERPGRRERAHRRDRTERGTRPYGGDRADRRDRNGRGRADADDRRDRADHHDRADRRVAGTVASYNPDRGFGFISRRGGADVFVHVSALAGRGQVLEAGQRVRFELAPGRRGQQARNVQTVS